jgi:hypothetical protein
MVSFSFQTTLFPDGASVGAYEATGYDTFPAGGPPGGAVATGTVDDSVIAFTGLEEDTPYFAAAKVGGIWRSTRFTAERAKPVAVETRDLASGVLLARDRGEEVAIGTFVNAKSFGALGDGATDDTEAIEAAISSFGEAGEVNGDTGNNQEGGILYFPPGEYRVSKTLVVFPGLVIQGAGPGTSLIRRVAKAKFDLFQTAGFAELSAGATNEGPFKFGFRDIWLDGGPEGVEGRGIAIYGRYYFIDNVQISSFPAAGLWSRWYAGGDQMEAKVSNVKVINCGSPASPAIDWHGPHDSMFHSVEVIRPNGVGIRTSEGNAAGTSFVNCHVWGETEDHKIAWLIEQASYLINCQGEGALETQLQANAGQTVVLGGHYFGFGEGDESVGIRIGEAAEEFPAGVRLATRASKCKTCVDFAGESGKSDISVICEPRSGGAVKTGEPHTTDRCTLIGTTSANSVDQRPKVIRTIASATLLVVPRGVEFVKVTGAVEIKEVEANADGQRLALKLEGTAKVADGANLKLAGNFEGAAGRMLELICDGGDWYELGRTAT